MKFRTALLAGSVLALPALALPGTASAQPISGLYIGAGVGYNMLQNESLKPSAALGTPELKTHFNGGIVGLGSIGYGLGNGLRFEVEGNYRHNNLDKITGTPFPTKGGGYQESYGVMVNALFDLDVGAPWIYPYIGVGAGYAWNTWHRLFADGTETQNLLRTGGTNGSFAYQGIVGASFPMAFMPGLSVTAEYRYFGQLSSGSYHATSFDTAGIHDGNLEMKNNIGNQSFLLGVRYAFNVAPPPAPAPAPVAAPAPAPARTYLVFFDWDRADLTPRARQIIREAAEASTRVQYTRIQVNGYTDTSGTTKYNMSLSIRRAQNVAAELVRNGVPRTAIDIKGFGETNPLVPTGPGVREPQNRRVEIIIQ